MRRIRRLAGPALAGLLGVFVGHFWWRRDALEDLRAPLEAYPGMCDELVLWPDHRDPFAGDRGDGPQRSSVVFRRHRDRATAIVIEDGLSDDSVEAVRVAYQLQWSAASRRWTVVSCERRVVSCAPSRGSPPVCS